MILYVKVESSFSSSPLPETSWATLKTTQGKKNSEVCESKDL